MGTDPGLIFHPKHFATSTWERPPVLLEVIGESGVWAAVGACPGLSPLSWLPTGIPKTRGPFCGSQLGEEAKFHV